MDLFASFQVREDEPLHGVTIYPGVRGVPIVFKTYDPDDAGTEGAEFEEAKRAASHIVIMASGHKEKDGDESCKVRVVVCTHMRDGEPAEQELRHERWCAAVRGIMSPAAQTDAVQLCNSLRDEVRVVGWEVDEPAQDEFIHHRWMHTQNYDFTAAMLGGLAD